MRGFPLYVIPLLALCELWLIIQVGGLIGVWPTIGLVLITGFIGVTLLRQQGFRLLGQLQQRLNRGEMPARELIEGVLLLIGGVLLLTPGFLTDSAGLFLLIPGSRRLLMGSLERRFQTQFVASMDGTPPPSMGEGVFRPAEPEGPDAPSRPGRTSPRSGGRLLEGEFTRED